MPGTDIRQEHVRIAAAPRGGGPAGAGAAAKRAVDVVVGVAATLLLLPLFVATAVAVAAAGSRPVLRREARIGREGRRFDMLSFAEPPGFLAGAGFGELPRLLNLVLGHISLVGPRAPFDDDAGWTTPPRVRPGLVGPAQVRALRGPVDEEEAARLDDDYAAGWSLRGDLHLLWGTVRAGIVARE